MLQTVPQKVLLTGPRFQARIPNRFAFFVQEGWQKYNLLTRKKDKGKITQTFNTKCNVYYKRRWYISYVIVLKMLLFVVKNNVKISFMKCFYFVI